MLEDERCDRHKIGTLLLPGAVRPPCEVTPEQRTEGGDQVRKAGGGGLFPAPGTARAEVWGDGAPGRLRSSPQSVHKASLSPHPLNHHAVCPRHRGPLRPPLGCVKTWCHRGVAAWLPRVAAAATAATAPPETHLGADAAVTTRGCHAPRKSSRAAQLRQGRLSSPRPRHLRPNPKSIT